MYRLHIFKWILKTFQVRHDNDSTAVEYTITNHVLSSRLNYLYGPSAGCHRHTFCLNPSAQIYGQQLTDSFSANVVAPHQVDSPPKSVCDFRSGNDDERSEGSCARLRLLTKTTKNGRAAINYIFKPYKGNIVATNSEDNIFANL